MSGWIKLEKDLHTDPRFLRTAKKLGAVCNGSALHRETLLLGCLARLWILADSHARDDDTLDMGPAEIDELVGVEGFCSVLPADWLQVLDADTVLLPEFQAHNGTEAKKRAQTAKRVERHRSASVTLESRISVSDSNASALPDQTRPDLDQTTPNQTVGAPQAAAPPTRSPRATRLPKPWPLTAELIAIAERYALDDVEGEHEEFCNYWHARAGKDATKLDWAATWSNRCRTVAQRQGRGNRKPAVQVRSSAELEQEAREKGQDPWALDIPTPGAAPALGAQGQLYSHLTTPVRPDKRGAAAGVTHINNGAGVTGTVRVGNAEG